MTSSDAFALPSRSALDLLDHPFSFTQLDLLTAEKFLRAIRDRGVDMSPKQLEGLHRVGLLPPLLRLRRDGRAIAAEAVRDPYYARQLASGDATWLPDLYTARTAGRLSDARDEPFVARRRLRRRVGELQYDASAFLYSQHQMVLLPTAQQALPFLRWREETVVGLDVHASWRDYARMLAHKLNDIVVAVSALEPVYYPKVMRSLRLSNPDFVRYERWRRRLALTAMLRWLGVEASWLTESAAELLRLADRFDPLGQWLSLVREADPDRWSLLKGPARNAMDLRIAAEVLLLYHDDLVRGRRARAVSAPQRRMARQFDTRLKTQGALDQVLTSFGLSPHPRLLLVVEGDTELAIFPRLMLMFGVRIDDDFIAIQNREGISKDLAALVSYAVAPRTEPEEGGRYLRLLRPPTSILVVTDAEGPMATAAQRARRAEVLVERIVRTLPREHRTAEVCKAMATLVHVDTWHRGGLSFEFAHFTDRQLAAAIAQLDGRRRQPTVEQRVGHIAKLRKNRGNLDDVLGGTSKVLLAEELWPLLERKIQRAEQTKAKPRIPIVRVLDHALRLAHENPRRNVVIPVG